MSFHSRAFDEGTLTKLEIFEFYARDWLPVFLSQAGVRPPSEIHVFDFFAGRGADSKGVPGSPIRLLRQLRDFRGLPGWPSKRVVLHLFDKSRREIQELERNIAELRAELSEVEVDIRALAFDRAFAEHQVVLANKSAAKLVFIDQCGVDHVTKDVFCQLIASPRCDFLFFISSSTLHRFREHPAIKQKIRRPDDYYHVHRQVLEYYRDFIPEDAQYFLAPFSIKKGANIYGLIFGSGHPLGIDKFLELAWKKNAINGEADFDIERDNMTPETPMLPLIRPTKVMAFEQDLEAALRDGVITDELGLIRWCYGRGMKRSHAKPVLDRLRNEGFIEADFRVPQKDAWKHPRPITLLRKLP